MKRTLFLLLFSFCFAVQLSAQATLEIKFQPKDVVYAYQISDGPLELYTCVVQNIAIVNSSEAKLNLNKVTLSVVRDSQVVHTIIVSKDKLDDRAREMATNEATGRLPLMEFKFQIQQYLHGITFSQSSKMGSNEAIIINSTPFLFDKLPEEIRVTAFFSDASNKNFMVENSLNVEVFSSKNSYSFPLEGSWSAFAAPSLNSHHRWAAIQEFSYDFIKMDATGNSHKKDGAKFKHYYAYGQPILAIGDGKVISVWNDDPESDVLLGSETTDENHWEKVRSLQMSLLEKGFEHLMGNHVIIEHPNGEYSYYMHLKPESVCVKVNDPVSKGQKIAALGQSGMSSEPHLHFQLSDGPNLLESRSLPIVFDNVGEKNWNILYGDVIQTVERK